MASATLSNPASRRGFLRGLTTLPLIGGGVTLIGAPSAVAAPITSQLLNAYNEWLFMERRLLAIEQNPGLNGRDAESFVPANTGAGQFHFSDDGRWSDPSQHPSTRAALVLSAVGCPWWGGIH